MYFTRSQHSQRQKTTETKNLKWINCGISCTDLEYLALLVTCYQWTPSSYVGSTILLIKNWCTFSSAITCMSQVGKSSLPQLPMNGNSPAQRHCSGLRVGCSVNTLGRVSLSLPEDEKSKICFLPCFVMRDLFSIRWQHTQAAGGNGLTSPTAAYHHPLGNNSGDANADKM